MLVIGGGLAGTSAALALLEHGLEVTLVEAGRRLGGRAGSIRLAGGELVDGCQHLMMRCCTNLWDYYRRTGVQEDVLFSDRITFVGRDRRLSTLGAGWLPAPFHLGMSLARLGFLGAKDKLAIGRALWKVLRQPPSGGSVSDWLSAQGQPARAVENFWRPIVLSALNEHLERTGAERAAQVFRDGFLSNGSAFHLGIPTLPLGRIHGELPLERLAADGGQVLFNTPARAIMVEKGRVAGISIGSRPPLTADHYLPAIPFHALSVLLPPEMAGDPFFRSLGELRYSPILCVHLWYDREVVPLDQAALVGREMQWVFNKSRHFGLDRPGYLALVSSGCRELVSRPRPEIAELARQELEACFPAAEKANLLRSLAIVQPRATFSPVPGCDVWRPPQVTPWPNLWLAGDWTRTGWPATMEGAVRSGYLAAQGILEAEGIQASVLTPDLPPGWLATRLMGSGKLAGC